MFDLSKGGASGISLPLKYPLKLLKGRLTVVQVASGTWMRSIESMNLKKYISLTEVS